MMNAVGTEKSHTLVTEDGSMIAKLKYDYIYKTISIARVNPVSIKA